MKNLLLLLLVTGVCFAKAQLINEFEPNPFGADPSTSTIELVGTPGAMLIGTIISIESDATSIGAIDRLEDFSVTFDANGIAVVTMTDLENPSFTLMLIQGSTVSLNDDLDSNDDGTIDNAGVLGTVLDAVGIPDNSSDILFANQVGGTDFVFTGTEPVRIFRDGVSTSLYAVNELNDINVLDAAGASYSTSDFDSDPSTGPNFGSVNESFLGPLPVALTSFTADPTAQGAQLNWEVASQYDNAYFAVEVSRDARDFTEIGRVMGDGTHAGAKRFAFEYDAADAGEYYFRLRQVDYDGAATLTDVIAVTIGTPKTLALRYALQDDFLQISPASPGELTVLSMTGQSLAHYTVGSELTTIDISDLPSGMFILTDGSTSRRFLH